MLTQDKDQISSVFNNYFIDSFQDLAQDFGLRNKVITRPNYNLPVFTGRHLCHLCQVSESSITTTLSLFKSSKAKDVFDCDPVFLKKYNSILSTLITHLVNLPIKNVIFPVPGNQQ